jgi:hypothetical protein
MNAANSSLQVDTKNPRTQTFWFGMGKCGLALILAISIAIIFYGFHLSDEELARKTPELLKWYAAKN